MAVTPKLRIDEKDLAKEIADLQGAAEHTYTITLAAGATNGMLVSIQAVDGFGVALAGVRKLEVFFSGSAVGAGLTATAYSGSLVASTGSIIATPVAAKSFVVLTDATGLFVGTLTATAKPATEYVAVVRPRGSLKVSAASAALWG